MLAAIRRFLREWVVPPGYLLLRQKMAFNSPIRLTPEEAALLSRNTKFKNMYSGRRCFVIGNGPSLNKQDLSPLANEITIVMNLFNRNPIIDKWKPTFFCMEEPAENIKRVGLSQFLEKIEAQAYFFQIGVKEILDEHKLLDVEKVYYFKLAGSINDYLAGHRSLDLTKPVPGAWTTAQTAIMLAIYIGCSSIYLIGVDHDGLAHPSMTWRHFYQDPQDEVEEIKYSYKFRMEQWLSIWKGYENLQAIANKKGIRIYNATAGGFLDVFPRVEFESLFKTVAGKYSYACL